MAKNLGTEARSNNTNQRSSNEESWRASGWMNVSLLNRKGVKRKVFGIPLKEVSPVHRAILEALGDGSDEEALAKLRELIVIDFNPNTGVDEDDFDL